MTALAYEELPISGDGPDWHAWRAGGIGASEAAAALGISPYTTPYELYLRKVGQLPPVAENDAMYLGKVLEPAVAGLYARKTGRRIVRSQVTLASVPHPFLRATIDGFDEDGIPVEFKTAGPRQLAEWGDADADSDHVPHHYLCQVYQQLIVTGAPVARVAVLLAGSEFRTYTVEANDRIASNLIVKLRAFWDRVERRDPPEPTTADASVILRAFPRVAATIELGDDELSLADEYASLGDEIRALENARSQVKARLALAMADHAVASLPDGRCITRKVTTRKAHIVAESTFVDMRILKPKGR